MLTHFLKTEIKYREGNSLYLSFLMPRNDVYYCRREGKGADRPRIVCVLGSGEGIEEL